MYVHTYSIWAIISFNSLCRPFSVTPIKSALKVDEFMQIDIKFLSEEAGFFSGAMAVHYDGGE